MLSVRLAGVEAYAATADLSLAGLQRALKRAEALARQIARYALIDQRRMEPATSSARYCSPGLDQPCPSLAERFELLAEESAHIPTDPRLVNWSLYLDLQRHEQLYLNSAGAEHWQELQFVYPGASVTAFDGHDSQTRSFGGYHGGQQGVQLGALVGLGLLAHHEHARLAARRGERRREQAVVVLLAAHRAYPVGRRDLLRLVAHLAGHRSRDPAAGGVVDQHPGL